MVCKRLGDAIVCFSPEFKVGDPPPNHDDYFAYTEWAETQYKGGLRQVQCPNCCLWRFPQQMSDKTIKSKYRLTKYGEEITEHHKVCKDCESKLFA